MIYADTDFFMALIKESDWLKPSAQRLLKEYKGKIWTSPATLAELLLMAVKMNLDPEKMMMDTLNYAQLRGGPPDVYMVAAVYIKDKKMGAFDALHAAFCGLDCPILSSDKIFDKLGMKRIRLEQKGDSSPAGTLK